MNSLIVFKSRIPYDLTNHHVAWDVLKKVKNNSKKFVNEYYGRIIWKIVFHVWQICYVLFNDMRCKKKNYYRNNPKVLYPQHITTCYGTLKVLELSFPGKQTMKIKRGQMSSSLSSYISVIGKVEGKWWRWCHPFTSVAVPWPIGNTH